MFGSPKSMFKEIQKWWYTSVISRLQWAGNQHRRTHSSTTPPLQSQLLWSKQHCSKQWEIDSEGRRLGVTPGIALWPAQVYSCNMLASSPRSFYTHATHIHTPYTQSKIIFLKPTLHQSLGDGGKWISCEIETSLAYVESSGQPELRSKILPQNKQ